MAEYWCSEDYASKQTIIATVKLLRTVDIASVKIKIEKVLYVKSHRDWKAGDDAFISRRDLKKPKKIIAFVFEVI